MSIAFNVIFNEQAEMNTVRGQALAASMREAAMRRQIFAMSSDSTALLLPVSGTRHHSPCRKSPNAIWCHTITGHADFDMSAHANACVLQAQAHERMLTISSLLTCLNTPRPSPPCTGELPVCHTHDDNYEHRAHPQLKLPARRRLFDHQQGLKTGCSAPARACPRSTSSVA